MDEQVSTQTITPPQPQTPAPAEEQLQVDLITRASQFKLPEVKTVTEPEFDFKDIEKIADPTAKDLALRAYKSFQKGFNEKFQEVSGIRKTLEQKMQEVSTWTPERVSALTKDPAFIKAAQMIIGESTNSASSSESSMMTDAEKAKIAQLETELNAIKQQSFKQQMSQQDEQLKSKYANYNPQAIDIIYDDMLTGKVQATREHLFKVVDYDAAVQRAYELGKQDAKSNTTEKINAMSFQPSAPTIKTDAGNIPQQNEKDTDFFRRAFLANVAKYGQK